MNIAKRLSYYFLAFALFAVMSLGSLSFMPKSFAVDDFVFPFYESDIPSPSSDYFVYLARFSSYTDYTFSLYQSANPFSISKSGSNGLLFEGSSTVFYLQFSNSTGRWSNGSFNVSSTHSVTSSGTTSLGSPLPYSSSSGVTLSLSGFSSFNYSFPVSPLSSIPRYWDYQSFYFPEMPHGYFDGNINVVDGSYSLDLSNVTGTTSNTGYTTSLEHYSFVVPYYHVTSNSSSSDFDFNDSTGIGHVQNSDYLSGNYTVTGQTTNTVHYVETGSLDINGSSPVSYVPAYNENSRFRCWSCVMDSSYVWFVSDTRNKITGSIVSVSSDEVTWQYVFSDPQGGNTIYPIWAIVFSPMGEVIQVLSPSIVANKNTYTLSCSIGTLEQDQDTGIWSCDPLYHGFWFSDDSPPVANITHLNVAENKKYLANPVFGESAFQLQFLDSINRGISDINSNIQSLQSAMQSSISGQTFAFQNMDAPSAPQPSTSQMMDYFSKESAFSAPNTDEVFSGDIKSGHYWDGVTWWSTKFNDIIVSNQVIVAFTTAMLTLGLAVLIIGRRFSMR